MPSERVGADHSVTGGHTASCLTSLARRRPSAGQAVHRIDVERGGAVTTELSPKLSKSKRQGRLHGRPFAVTHRWVKMLRCGPSKRPLVHRAALHRLKHRSADLPTVRCTCDPIRQRCQGRDIENGADCRVVQKLVCFEGPAFQPLAAHVAICGNSVSSIA